MFDCDWGPSQFLVFVSFPKIEVESTTRFSFFFVVIRIFLLMFLSGHITNQKFNLNWTQWKWQILCQSVEENWTKEELFWIVLILNWYQITQISMAMNWFGFCNRFSGNKFYIFCFYFLPAYVQPIKIHHTGGIAW